MQYATMHRNGDLADLLLDPDTFQTAPTAIRQGQVDRLSGRDVGLSHIGPAFVDRHFIATTGQVDGQERADQTGS